MHHGKKMEMRKETALSMEDPHLCRASPRLSYCPPRSYSRSTVKRENPPTNISPASLSQEQLCLVKSELTSPSPSPSLISCMQPSSERSTVPLIKSEPQLSQQQLQQQLLTVPQLVIKSEHTTLTRPLVTSPNLLVKNEDDLSHSTTTSPGLTTDLENFQDLSEWCRRQPSQQKPPMDAMEALPETDELNTPLIEQGEEFLFTSPTILNGPTNNITTVQDDDDCYGLLMGSVVQPSDFAIDFYACADIHSAAITAQHNDNNNVLFECDTVDTGTANNVFQDTTTAAEYQQYFINDIGGGDTTTTAATTTDHHHVLNYSASTIMDNSFNIFTNTTIPATISDGSPKCADVLYNHHHHQSTTQASATSHCSNEATQPKSELVFVAEELEPANNAVVQAGKKNLRLDFSNLWMADKVAEEQATIDTPEVISTALAMENTGFNLVKFINDSMVLEDLAPSAPSPEEDADDQSQSASTSNDPTYSTSEVSEDEDYEPPWTKRAKLSSRAAKKPAKTKTIASSRTSNASSTVDLSSLLKRDVYDSDLSNISTAESSIVKVVRRGRPPKRNVSISSESTNADTEVSRYRELRDKNNEASRRSRLNRKMKEQHLEQEASDLETRNRKLKVRVSELDKLVNSMRNNLMQMLLKK